MPAPHEIVGTDDVTQARELAREAMDCKIGQKGGETQEPLDRARVELFGLAQLMLTVMKESAKEDMQTHGGPAWKAFAHALWAEHDLRQGNT